ncbi:lytic transglycosylase domain-containing protein [Plantibacter sp. LMC-P-059a]|jgi:membrane-bound lytic murein transglycosylase B|uniref:lytic transglycosylase domain-containing protein n=1 Tax=Plantibacter sp. LMC-P-059a TaxID=3040297 RepID=UPI0025506406|nr:lytic transglycosylase domain-containing protein [Plantibacter sp. LMC-P-059a]
MHSPGMQDRQTATRRRRSLAGASILLGAILLSGCAPEPEPVPYAQPVELPPKSDAPDGGVANVDLADEAWVAEVSSSSGIPERALRSYAGAAIRKAELTPECGIGWTTIAAVGFAESDHGRHDGSKLGEDGVVTPPIFGVPLQGGETEEITDTDQGVLDGDPVHDRAVGPFQFIPESWKNWGTDASGDGVLDPQNLDDAAMAAANYLCRASDYDMRTEAGWLSGIRAYNSSPEYLRRVAAAANEYAEAVPSVGK